MSKPFNRDIVVERGKRLRAVLPMLRWKYNKSSLCWEGTQRDSQYPAVEVSSQVVCAWTEEQKSRGQTSTCVFNGDNEELVGFLSKWRDDVFPLRKEPPTNDLSMAGSTPVSGSSEPHSRVSALDAAEQFQGLTHDPAPRDLIEERGDKLKTLLPMLRWERLKRRNAWCGRNSTTNLGEVCVDDSGLVSAWTEEQGQDHPTAIVNVSFEEDGDLIAILKIWRDSAYPQAAPNKLIDRMREAVPELEWAWNGSELLGKQQTAVLISADPNGLLLCWIEDESEPYAVSIAYPGDDAAVRIVREWWDKTHPPSRDPIAERGERLKALLPMLEWRLFGQTWCGYREGFEEVTATTTMVQAWTEEQTQYHPDALKASYTTDDELMAWLATWRDATYPQQSSHISALIEAVRREITADLIEGIRSECPEANAYIENEDVYVSWNGSQWRFVRVDTTHWKTSDATWTLRDVVRFIRDHIDTHTLAEDQSLKGLTGVETTALQGERITQEAPPMESETLAETIAADATDAAWRTAASQLVKLSREPLIGLLTRHLAPGDEAVRSRIAVFLQTELGGSLLASMLSASLSAMPYSSDASNRLARELRVRAMSHTFESFAALVFNALVTNER